MAVISSVTAVIMAAIAVQTAPVGVRRRCDDGQEGQTKDKHKFFHNLLRSAKVRLTLLFVQPIILRRRLPRPALRYIGLAERRVARPFVQVDMLVALVQFDALCAFLARRD